MVIDTHMSITQISLSIKMFQVTNIFLKKAHGWKLLASLLWLCLNLLILVAQPFDQLSTLSRDGI